MCRPPSLSQILARTASNVQHCKFTDPTAALMYLNYSESCPTFTTTTISQRAVSRPASALSSQSSFYIRSSHEALRPSQYSFSRFAAHFARCRSAPIILSIERDTLASGLSSNRTRNNALREMMEERKKKLALWNIHSKLWRETQNASFARRFCCFRSDKAII